MARKRIGELLGKLVPLSHLDVEEILHEQRRTRRRFGEIALAMGLCRPEHLWEAWSNQLVDRHEKVNLAEVGIDGQAVSLFPYELATRHRVMPMRIVGESIIVAAAHRPELEALQEMTRRVGLRVRYVLADQNEIDRALAEHYEAVAA